MAVILNIGKKVYHYTPRHPFKEELIQNGYTSFRVLAPDNGVLFSIKGEEGDIADRTVIRAEDFLDEEIQCLLKYGFFGPYGIQPTPAPHHNFTERKYGSFLKMLNFFERR